MALRNRDPAPSAPGRGAERPSDFGARGWKEILLRVKREVSADKLSLLAAGVAFMAMLALFPSLIAAVSIYGLLFDPADLQSQLAALPGNFPTAARDLMQTQLGSIVESSGGGLTVALVLSILAALWSASSGMQGLMQAVAAAYDEEETRSAIRLRLLALAGTLGAILVFLIAIALLTVLPAVLNVVGLGPAAKVGVQIARWVLLAAVALLGLGVLYRYAPDRDRAKWRWVTWGAAVAAGLWLLASALFSWYVSNFGNYNATYGSLGAVIVLMLWLWVTAFTVLLGAEVNAEMEHQTARDTTRGQPEPRGRRGAFVADHLPERAD